MLPAPCPAQEGRDLFSILISFPLGIYPEVEFLGCREVLFLISREASIMLSIVANHFSFPPAKHKGSLHYIVANICYFLTFDNSLSDRCEVILTVVLICTSLISHVEHLFTRLSVGHVDATWDNMDGP